MPLQNWNIRRRFTLTCKTYTSIMMLFSQNWDSSLSCTRTWEGVHFWYDFAYIYIYIYYCPALMWRHREIHYNIYCFLRDWSTLNQIKFRCPILFVIRITFWLEEHIDCESEQSREKQATICLHGKSYHHVCWSYGNFCLL